jgi:sugar phosphate isomerase/epimerase
MRRREFLMTGLAASGLGAVQMPASILDRICLFTDHLSGFDYNEVAKMLQQLRVSGPDLTVRPGGLVKPERVEQDLPKAAAIFKQYGMAIPMITTAITSVEEGRPILSSAAKLGIRYYKLGYFPYTDMNQWKKTRQSTRESLAQLTELGRQLKTPAGFHNHSGPLVGGTIWDALELVGLLDSQAIGLYFDPSHATIEGGKNGWNFSLRMAAERLKMVAIKDFIWEKVGGEWKTRWVPLGQGMVPFEQFFKILATTRFPGPISLHIEYDPGGATKAARFENSLAAAARDLRFLREHLDRAYQQA